MSSTASIQQVLARPEHTSLVRDLLADPALRTRNSLATEVCRRRALRDPRGALHIATAAKALRDLEAQGLWKLPPPTQSISKRWMPQRLPQRVPPPKAVPPRVEAVEGLHLLEATTDEHLQLWNELMLREHPLHQCRLVGRQLRYLVGSDHGWLGAIGFGSASLYLEDRDTWIGWSEAPRMEHRPRVLHMNRFLIRPGVHCENLASRVLALCARQVARDFERRYGLEPWLLESFVDGSQYDGACYKAANWVCVGQTKGRGRNGKAVGIKSMPPARRAMAWVWSLPTRPEPRVADSISIPAWRWVHKAVCLWEWCASMVMHRNRPKAKIRTVPLRRRNLIVGCKGMKRPRGSPR